MRNNKNIFWTPLTLLALMAVACQPSSKVTTNTSPASSSAIAPANMARVGTIDDRYQSYNVEMLEVTGGWSRQIRGDRGCCKTITRSGSGLANVLRGVGGLGYMALHDTAGLVVALITERNQPYPRTTGKFVL